MKPVVCRQHAGEDIQNGLSGSQRRLADLSGWRWFAIVKPRKQAMQFRWWAIKGGFSNAAQSMTPGWGGWGGGWQVIWIYTFASLFSWRCEWSAWRVEHVALHGFLMHKRRGFGGRIQVYSSTLSLANGVVSYFCVQMALLDVTF